MDKKVKTEDLPEDSKEKVMADELTEKNVQG